MYYLRLRAESTQVAAYRRYRELGQEIAEANARRLGSGKEQSRRRCDANAVFLGSTVGFGALDDARSEAVNEWVRERSAGCGREHGRNVIKRSQRH